MSSRINIPKELLDQVSRGNCVIFVGAGPSQGAGLPNWPQLLRQMLDWAQAHGVEMSDRAELEGYIAGDEVLLAAEELQERMGNERFRKFMSEVFRRQGLKPTEAHLLIPRIPFAAAVTTNYEDLLETAYTVINGEKPHVFTHRDVSELSAALRTDEFYILKAHGTIDRMETIVLGHRSYRDVIHSNRPYRQHLTSLFSGKTVLFIGFGLTDPDLLLLLDEMRAIFSDRTGHHFALMDERSVPAVKRKRFEKDYGIVIIPYTPSAPDHPEVREFLEALVKKQERAEPSAPMAETVLQRVDELNKELAKDESPDFRLIAQVVIEPKPSESGEARPLPLSMEFDFSGDDPETRQAREDFKRHIETGAPIRIKSPHLKGFTLPDAMRKLVQPAGEDAVIELRPRPSTEQIPVKFEIECDDGETSSLDYIVLRRVQGGTEETTLSNAEQTLVPWKITIAINRKNGTFKFDCDMHYSGLNVFQALAGLRFSRAMSKGGHFRMVNLLNGFVGQMTHLAPGMYPSPDPILLELTERLVFIQSKTNTLFTAPERDLSMEEVTEVFDTARIIETGHDTIHVKNMTARGGVEMARNALEGFGGEPKYLLWQSSEDRVVTMLGVEVSLGPLVMTCNQTIITEEDKEVIRRALESAEAEDAPQDIPIRFTPVNDCPVEVRYPRWLPEDEAASLRNLLDSPPDETEQG
jgi:LmbE family N-acetylglucosaminyl deacetylase